MTALDRAPVELRDEHSPLEGLADFIGVTPCYYCGVPADTIDHVIPRHILESLATLADPEVSAYYNRKHKVKTFPACRECNSLIGAKYFGTLAERKDYLKERLRRHYRNVLGTGEWSDRDLGELEYNLQGYIVGSIHAKELLLRRLAW